MKYVTIKQGSVWVESCGPLSFLETRQLVQDLIAACFEVSTKDERDEFVNSHPTIKCGDKLPGALGPA